MATYKHLRSSTANKRPTTSITDGQLAINTNTASPGLFFKDSAGTGIVKVGPVHVGTTAPNATPAAGGSSGNYLGEQWLDTSVSPAQMKVWNGSAWVGIVADELPVSKLQDGDARQLLQTDAAGTGVEWTSNVDVPGTLDVTGATTLDSTLTVPLGSAASPTLRFSGDANSGLYSPGADQVAISTNGAGRVFVNASGNVQIGSSFAGVANGSGLEIERSTTSAIRLTGASGVGCEFFNTGTLASIQTRSTIPFTIQTNELERLRITSAGLVGIGTSTPGANLEVFGDTADVVLTSVTNNNATGANKSLNCGVGGATAFSVPPWPNSGFIDSATTNGLALGSSSSTGSVRLYTGTSREERLRITSAGNVGIGTTSPVYAFVVSAAGASGIEFGPAYSGTANLIQHYSRSGFVYVDAVNDAAQHRFQISGTERARIDSSGRLLVGTSTNFDQSAPLQVNSSTGESANLYVFGADNSRVNIGSARGSVASPSTLNSVDTIGGIYFRGHDGTSFKTGAQIQAQIDGITPSSDLPSRLVFSTTADGASSPTERMRIANTGATDIFSSTANVLGAGSNQAAGTVYYLFYGANNASSTTTGTTCFVVFTNGNVQNTNNSYAGISDAKLKENIVDATSQWSDIKALQVRKYNFKEGQTHTQIGLIAQEVELISPGLVIESPDRDAEGNDLGTVTKSVNYSVVPFSTDPSQTLIMW
jgi:hypothetical protein